MTVDPTACTSAERDFAERDARLGWWSALLLGLTLGLLAGAALMTWAG